MAYKVCTSCGGAGFKIETAYYGSSPEKVTVNCSNCFGSGQLFVPDPVSAPYGSDSGSSPSTPQASPDPSWFELLAYFIASRLAPLRWLIQLSEWLDASTWRMKLPLAILGACAADGFSKTLPYPSEPKWGAALIGAFLGAVVPIICAMLFRAFAKFVAFLLAALTLGLCVAILYGVCAFFAGWPPFSSPLP
jgi:uncharacterized membrane protein YeaQ/YmgE (transglycosylase-associated protein family)